MEFFRKAAGFPSQVGIFPGTFNPVTVAHLALAHAALPHVDELVLVLPRQLPHKRFEGASFEQRIAMLETAVHSRPEIAHAFSIAAAERGLFLDIAVECRTVYGPNTRFTFLCGRDAAERIAGWDYAAGPETFAAMLNEFSLLVAARSGEYAPPPGLEHAIRRLELTGEFDHVSATEVRDRIARGQEWRQFVPEALHEAVTRLYRS